MKEIYIVLSYTGTILSRMVKFYTKKTYSHISIALDKHLKDVYSFGRINPYNPFTGGFVQEGIDIGTIFPHLIERKNKTHIVLLLFYGYNTKSK